MKVNNAQKIYDETGAEAVLTESADLRFYLTGVETSFGYVLSDKNGTVFYTDSRYVEAVENALANTDIEVKLFKPPFDDIVKKYREIAVPFSRTLYPAYKKLADLGLKVLDSDKAFNDAMAIKQAYEIKNIKQACRITDEAFLQLLPLIKEGMSENDVACELEYLMRKKGASGTSFDTIVAFGANSSAPHHETGMKKLKFGDIVLIDFGCKVNGYCSDCTRTFLFGDDHEHEEFKSVYQSVLNAHMLVKEKLTVGMTGKQADAIARDSLKAERLDKYFTHSLGHGIGINVHEFPYLSPKGEGVLQNGMVFSDEPGVYFAGEYGVRIEDTVTLSGGKVQSLTDSDKKLIIL